ncbi:MAG TPA: M3 family metallopeptidase [Kofleriaceae bacterium]|nr:M3 family metallopeptidase [Kofleriaceae bacterium]
MPDPTPSAPPAPSIPSSSSHEAATAEVARLRAIADRDPLLAPWPGEHGGVPPWDRVTPAAFPAAFAHGIALREAELAAITTDPAPPTFANTIAPFEDLGRHQRRAEALFSVLSSSVNTPEVQQVEETWSPRLTAAADRISFDPALFARIAAVHEARAASGLTDEQRRLVELTHDRFVRRGARLDAAQQARLGEINQQLATLFTEFNNKLLADEDTWTVLDDAADLAGLPPDLVAAYKAAADERGLAGRWAVLNTRSSVDPFLTSSARRDLRERVWKKFKDRGDHGDERDTRATIVAIVRLRAERAKLLGYPSHAAWRMSDTMAIDPARARDLMMRVWPAAVARVREEVADMQAIAAKEDAAITLEPWDYLYYAEKVRKARYDLDQDELKPYFELDSMIEAAMWMGEQLYGLRFEEITGTVPVFQPDVRVWKVSGRDGATVGVFYGDYFARPAKRSGAWMEAHREHETFTGTKVLPVTSNNNNFVRGAPGEPVLISLDDAQTLFHEFGHALHSLLSEVRYPGLAETPRDFVEYPSQVHEQWVLSPRILDRFARHHRTGAAMPQALLDKIERARRFNQGYATVEYLSSAIVDLELHTRPDGITDVDGFERDTLARIGAPREVTMRHRLPQFAHLFSSDAYSAGYYSYLWSEVMDADTRLAFQEAGDMFDATIAEKLRTHILAPGNSTDRGEAYRRFRGRDPEVRALLLKRGFPTT